MINLGPKPGQGFSHGETLNGRVSAVCRAHALIRFSDRMLRWLFTGFLLLFSTVTLTAVTLLRAWPDLRCSFVHFSAHIWVIVTLTWSSPSASTGWKIKVCVRTNIHTYTQHDRNFAWTLPMVADLVIEIISNKSSINSSKKKKSLPFLTGNCQHSCQRRSEKHHILSAVVS